MNLLTTAAWSTIGGAAIGSGLLAKDQARWNEVDAWAEEIAAADRHHLLNRQPLPEMPEPPHPASPQLMTSPTWLLIPLAVWLIPALLVAVAVGAVMTTREALGPSIAGAALAFVIASIPALLVAVLVGALVNTYRVRKNQQARLGQEILGARHGVWALREDARQELARGIKPVTYLEAIGLDPQRL
ncbi:hypothetical protein [Kocuria palustris]|uniref:hypothetical protein n=1 Tax=Kocuria palustris TaxID=71999 RepID=UPI00077B7D7E|nr:hypothetical protein [Kocuria palustris]